MEGPEPNVSRQSGNGQPALQRPRRDALSCHFICCPERSYVPAQPVGFLGDARECSWSAQCWASGAVGALQSLSGAPFGHFALS